MGALDKIVYFSIFSILSVTIAATNDDTPLNKIEDNADAAARSARYIKLTQGNPYYYYPTGSNYIPNRDYNYYNDRYPTVSHYPGGGTTSFYPTDRYPNKFDPNYWLSKLPGFPTQNTPNYNNPNYPNVNYPSYPQGGTNFIGYNPNTPSRYPGYPGGNNPGYTPGYTPGYIPGNNPGYIPGNTPGYNPSSGGYPASGNGGYGGYGGNGGFTSYSGYDGYYGNGNRPGNIGFGYQNSRTNGVIGSGGRYPSSFSPIATPATVSKDARK